MSEEGVSKSLRLEAGRQQDRCSQGNHRGPAAQRRSRRGLLQLNSPSDEKGVVLFFR